MPAWLPQLLFRTDLARRGEELIRDKLEDTDSLYEIRSTLLKYHKARKHWRYSHSFVKDPRQFRDSTRRTQIWQKQARYSPRRRTRN